MRENIFFIKQISLFSWGYFDLNISSKDLITFFEEGSIVGSGSIFSGSRITGSTALWIESISSSSSESVSYILVLSSCWRVFLRAFPDDEREEFLSTNLSIISPSSSIFPSSSSSNTSSKSISSRISRSYSYSVLITFRKLFSSSSISRSAIKTCFSDVEASSILDESKAGREENRYHLFTNRIRNSDPYKNRIQ